MSEQMEQYKSGKWKGKDKYQCPLCPFDTLHPAVLVDHLRKHSAPKKQEEEGEEGGIE